MFCVYDMRRADCPDLFTLVSDFLYCMWLRLCIRGGQRLHALMIILINAATSMFSLEIMLLLLKEGPQETDCMAVLIFPPGD